MNYKFWILVIIGILVLTGCKNEQQKFKNAHEITKITTVNKRIEGYKIQGKVFGYPDGTKVYVNGTNPKSTKPFYEAKILIDSVLIHEQRFEIDLPYFDATDFHYLTFEHSTNYIFYIIENQPISIEVYKDTLGVAKIKGGAENTLFAAYNTQMINFGKRYTDNDQNFLAAKKQNDVAKIAALKSNKYRIRAEEKSYLTSFVAKHTNSVVSLILLFRVSQSKTLAVSEIKNNFILLDSRLKKSRIGIKLARIIGENMSIGDQAPSFSAPTNNGEILTLKKAMGTITLIDFWASWCKPCRIENPNVVRLYKKYHKKGLNIISVSLDRDFDHWNSAIKKDQLAWQHVSNLKYWEEPIAKSYGVNAIPVTFLLDANGIIIAKNLSGRPLENKIASILDHKP